jgi:Tfp pilus assembly protein PilF
VAVAIWSARLGGQPCDDPARLASDAEEILVARGSDAEAIAQARDLVRRARLLSPSLLGTLRGADLALAAGDDAERTQLLLAAAAESAGVLSAEERLFLARAAEARGDRRGAILQYGHLLTLLQRGGGEALPWIGERIRRLDAEEEAGVLPARPSLRAPTAAARESFEDGKKALSRGSPAAAREAFRRALRASPGYVEAALALGALEAREGRSADAVAAYRTALAADPDRFEAALSLSNLLWDEPDRQAKGESLALLERALALQPDVPRLYRDAALRWAAWGDAARALEKLELYRSRVDPAERSGTDAFRDRLRASVGRSGTPAPPAEPSAGASADPAAARPFQLAQVLFRRGDEASLASALGLLAEAVQSDPRFVPALELAARIREKQGNPSGAEEELRRAIGANPARAATHEALARLLAKQPGRAADALVAWRDAERAGSREALFTLGLAAARSGRQSEAVGYFRRYLAESPEGPYAEEAAAGISAVARAEARRTEAALLLAFAALAGTGAWLLLRHGGLSLAEWLARDPSKVREVRAAAGRLRHETLKHGGLLLEGAAADVRSAGGLGPEAAARLSSRLFGGNGGPGLVAEGRRSFDSLAALGRRDGVRLNLRWKDPLLAPVARALGELERERARLAALVRGDPLSGSRRARLARRLGDAARVLSPAASRDLGRLLDEAGSTPVDFAGLEAILAEAAREAATAPPPLAPIALPEGDRPVRARIDRADWATLWRNLFANALASPRLALETRLVHENVTGLPLVRLVLFDADPRPLTSEMIRGRAAERGLGVVADIVRRHEGLVDVVPPPTNGSFTKGILVELPAVEGEP